MIEVYRFTLPNAMRVFKPTGPQSSLLLRTDEVLFPETTIEITTGTMSYDHRDKLVIEIQDQSNRYLLIEEIDEEIQQLAQEWTAHRERIHTAIPQKPAIDDKQFVDCVKSIVKLLNKYFFLIELVGFETTGPGVRLPVAILHQQ
ncbi:MAG: hypothetical protein AAB628_00870 [Patescibacteria group bacterium]